MVNCGTRKCWCIAGTITILLLPLLGCLIGIIFVGVCRLPGTAISDEYSVGDTLIINIDLILCYGVTLTVNRGQSAVNGTLYALSAPPVLDGKNELNHTLQYHGNEQYKYAYFYMYRGSNVTIWGCTRDNSYTVYVIMGRNNFTLWVQKGERGATVVFKMFTVDAKVNCGTHNYYSFPTFSIPEADVWYFATDKNAAASSNVHLRLQRYEYTVKSSSILSSCVAGGQNHPESCTVVKSKDATYLLKFGPGKSNSIVTASFDCAVDGGSVAAIILAVSFVAMVSLEILIFYTYCTCDRRWCRRGMQQMLCIIGPLCPCHGCVNYEALVNRGD